MLVAHELLLFTTYTFFTCWLLSQNIIRVKPGFYDTISFTMDWQNQRQNKKNLTSQSSLYWGHQFKNEALWDGKPEPTIIIAYIVSSENLKTSLKSPIDTFSYLFLENLLFRNMTFYLFLHEL